MNRLRVALALSLFLTVAGCGGGGGGGGGGPAPSPTPTPSPANVMALSVNGGPFGSLINGGFTDVRICSPGTTTCQTLTGILVDTGSYGLRIFSSLTTTPLTQETDSSGNPIGECAVFGSFATWGPVKTAAIHLGGESAVTVPVQIINDPAFSAAPSACTSAGVPLLTSPSQFGFNGILGIGVFRQDCGDGCTQPPPVNPGLYYSCPSSGCSVTEVALADQVQNPVWLLPVDNNGLLITLPSVGPSGAPSASGAVIIGIGTESNNSLGSASVYTTDSEGNFTTTYKGTPLPMSFIDSGSNGLFFPDSSITQCSSSSNAPGFYCLASTLALSATNTGANGTSGVVDFSIENANTLVATGNNAFDDIGGPFSGGFDWGLPFFFGRKVFVGIEGQSTPGGTGPFWAY